MTDPLEVFNKWCDEFPSYLDINNMNLIDNLVYFDQVLEYYRANFILCEPYQQFTDKFITVTVPNALSKMLAFPVLNQHIYLKIKFIFAKYIDLAAQLIIRNIPFYIQFSTIPDGIFSSNSNFMKSNQNGRSDLQETVQSYPYSAVIEWMQKKPIIDWHMFHFLISYIFFISKYISLDDALIKIIPLLKHLISQTLDNQQNIDESLFPTDMNFLLFLSLKTQFKLELSRMIIDLIVSYIMSSSDVNFINMLIIVLEANQKNKDIDLIIKQILNDHDFDKFLVSPKTPQYILQDCVFYLIKYDKELILKSFIAINTEQIDGDRFRSVLLDILPSFGNLNSVDKADIISHILKGNNINFIFVQLSLILQYLDDKDTNMLMIVDVIIKFFYNIPDLLDSLVRNKIKNVGVATKILHFLINHSNEEKSCQLLKTFSKNNSDYFSCVSYEDYQRVLLKNDLFSFYFYLICIEKSGLKITLESMKIIWSQMLQSSHTAELFRLFFETDSLYLFCKESLTYFMNSLLGQDYSNFQRQMIDLIIDLIYLQDKTQGEGRINKTINITSFNQRGMSELFKCYLTTNKQSETFSYVKTNLLNLWSNCDIRITFERNESLSEIMMKNAQTEDQYIRCFDFLYEFMKKCSDLYLLEDLGYTHLKNQREIQREKSMTLSIELVQTTQKQSSQNGEPLRGTMNFSPSDLCLSLANRARLKFKCNKVLNVKYFGKILKLNSTLEMNGISNNSVIQLEYDFIEKKSSDFQYLNVYMPQMLLYCAPIYQKAIDLLHADCLSSGLASSVLKFIYYLPISSQLDSLLDTSDVISKAINDSVNVYERELFLRVLYHSIENARIKSMLVQSHFHKVLIDVFIGKELNNAGFKLALSILTIIWPLKGIEGDDEVVFRSFINKVICLMIDEKVKSRRLIDICAELLLRINQTESCQKVVNDEIKTNLMKIVTKIQWKIFGKIISHLKNKGEIYDILVPHLDEFSAREDRCSIYFDALFSSIDVQTKDAKVVSEFAVNHLYDYGPSVFVSLCEFIITQPDLYERVDVRRFIRYVEENETGWRVFKLIGCIYQKVPLKRDDIIQIASEYVQVELPEYNINENYVIKKSPLGSGVRNLSNTCYIGSSLQLLFNIEQFRTKVLMCDHLSSQWQKKLQSLFAVKEFGLLPVVDPSDFVGSYEMNGVKINVAEQQDASEFLMSIIDGVPQDLLSYFCGSLSNIFSGINYPYSSSNSEKFLCLSLDVDGCESLERSLSRFVGSEIVDDYKVQGQKESITVKKTAVIEKLPKVLLIQLRRFVYNFKTASKEKLNSYLAFPLTIDMSKYCAQTAQENYRLSGFILHSGNADCGHFHCVGYDRKLNTWIDYNDSITSQYNISNLEKDAFGSSFKDKGSNQSAYVLMYEKVGDGDVTDYELKVENISESLREAIKAEEIKAKRISCVMGDDFYELAMKSNDIAFLYNYFTKSMIHMNNVQKCAAVKEKLQNLIKENKTNFQLVIELLECDQVKLVTPIIYIKNDAIIQVWIDFLKFVIKNSENGESYCFATTFLNCIDVFKNSPSQVTYFAEIGKEILRFKDSLFIAQSQGWDLKFMIVLATIIQDSMKSDMIDNAKFDLFFEDLILMAPIIEKSQKELLNSLGPFVNLLSPKTQKLYNDLLYALSTV